MADEFILKNAGSADSVKITAGATTIAFSRASSGAALATSAFSEGTAVADLTENSGAIGGTNDGDLPDLTTPGAAANTAAVRELATTVNALLASLRASGIIAT